MPTVTIDLEDKIAQEIGRIASVNGISPSQVVNDIVAIHLYEVFGIEIDFAEKVHEE